MRYRAYRGFHKLGVPLEGVIGVMWECNRYIDMRMCRFQCFPKLEIPSLGSP